jgi:hypothetical protein
MTGSMELNFCSSSQETITTNKSNRTDNPFIALRSYLVLPFLNSIKAKIRNVLLLLLAHSCISVAFNDLKRSVLFADKS